MRVLLAGFTTRGLAESAVRAGHDVVSVDYFGDLDQKALCRNVSLRERGTPYSARAIVVAARALAADAIAYAGGLENHPRAVAALAAGRRLLGNGPATLRRVRAPRTLLGVAVQRGFAVPPTVFRGRPLPRTGRWLVKPLRGAGGAGVREWRGEPLPRGRMLQAFVEGTPASAIFAADGRRAVVLGLTEQLHGPRGFAYGGNVLPLAASDAAWREIGALAAALTEEFGLVGINGIDFVLRGDRPVLLEVNPRYSASMELLERATGLSVFGIHVAACEGTLPAPEAPGPGAWGKAIVYAPGRLAVPDTRGWLAEDLRDVPHPGDVIERGHPVCSVLAQASDRESCLAALGAASRGVLARLVPAPPARRER